MKVRAKFKVVSSEHSGDGRDIQNINLVAVVDDSDENKTFFKYTPAGSINLGVVNQAAAEFFQVGKELHVDFSNPNEAPQAMGASEKPTFKFGLGQVVSIFSGERGDVRGRAESLSCEPQYHVAYTAADGRAVLAWWDESLLSAI